MKHKTWVTKRVWCIFFKHYPNYAGFVTGYHFRTKRQAVEYLKTQIKYCRAMNIPAVNYTMKDFEIVCYSYDYKVT